jgi:hypothetical protein
VTFLAPIFLYVAAGVAAGVIALHFIVTRQPTSSPLPTVRFIPMGSVRVTTVAPVPEDLILLALRVLLVLLIGAAFARPVLVPAHRSVARVVLADVSRDVGQIEMVRDSAHALLGQGDVLITFDSTARVVQRHAADSARRLVRSERDGRLSLALIAALRTAATLRASADSIELAIVSPLRSNEVDGATAAIRALWPGRIRLVRVPGSRDSIAVSGGFTLRAATDDPLALAAAAEGVPHDPQVRIVRDAATPADSTWAATGHHTLVRWPAAGAPPGWVARPRVDTVGAVSAGEAALVIPLERRWQLDTATHAARVVARWVDSEPAAVERTLGAGCIRDVAVSVPTRGDVMLRPSFARFFRALGAPCRAAGGGPALDAHDVEMLAGTGPLAPATKIRPPETIVTPLVPWLLAGAIVLLVLEIAVRRGAAPAWTASADDAGSVREVA